MPLHLLSKKSWNVYNPTSVAQVRADEAVAKAHEEEQERIQDEYDAKRRFAKLRGLPSPPEPERLPPPQFKRTEKRPASDPTDRDAHKRQRKRQGEDDTDRDIRNARENAERTAASDDRRVIKYSRDKNTEIIDHAGNIQLFAPPTTRDIRAQKNAEAEAEKKKSERQLEDQHTMRFSNAAGNQNNIKGSPWYTSSSKYSGTEELDDKVLDSVSDFASSGVDAFGRDDPGRATRDARRRQAADPLTAIMAGTAKLKQKKEAQERANEERARELRILKREEKGHRRERRRESRRGIEDAGSLDRTRLDGGRSRGSERLGFHEDRHYRRSSHHRDFGRSRDEHHQHRHSH